MRPIVVDAITQTADCIMQSAVWAINRVMCKCKLDVKEEKFTRTKIMVSYILNNTVIQT